MISQLSEFNLLERGFKEVMLLIPGWATDHRIFMNLDLRYNYVLPTKFYPFNFERGLLRWLEENHVGRISLFGWSLGGFLACDFASENPHWIDELVLLGICKGFKQGAIDEVSRHLEKNMKAYLFKFYLECFSPTDKEGLNWFKEHLLRKYIDQADTGVLMDGLDYLSRARINTESLAHVRKIRIFHGGEDKIAPLKEAMYISSMLPQAKFYCLTELGHIPFLNRDFKEKFNNE